jgi:tetratricopeptide (TPR) repeat protein
MTDKGSVENVEAFIEIGGDFYEQGAYDEAIFWFDEALAIEPNNLDALNGKGLSLYELGKYQEAIIYYDKALAIEPNDIYALINKGVTMKTLSTSFTASFRVSGL